MTEQPRIKVYPHGDRPDWRDLKGPALVSIKHRGIELRLAFKLGRKRLEHELLSIEFRPDTAKLEPGTLRQFASQTDMYVAAARAALSMEFKDARRAVEALRVVGRPGRGLTDDFYRIIAMDYDAMVDGGERHPIKALAAKHNTVISTASRWIKEARRRGLIKEAPDV